MDPSIIGLIAGTVSAVGFSVQAVLAALSHRGDRKAGMIIYHKSKDTKPLMAVLNRKRPGVLGLLPRRFRSEESSVAKRKPSGSAPEDDP